MTFWVKAVENRVGIKKDARYLVYAAEMHTSRVSSTTAFLLWVTERGGWTWITSEAFSRE